MNAWIFSLIAILFQIDFINAFENSRELGFKPQSNVPDNYIDDRFHSKVIGAPASNEPERLFFLQKELKAENEKEWSKSETLRQRVKKDTSAASWAEKKADLASQIQHTYRDKAELEDKVYKELLNQVDTDKKYLSLFKHFEKTYVRYKSNTKGWDKQSKNSALEAELEKDLKEWTEKESVDVKAASQMAIKLSHDLTEEEKWTDKKEVRIKLAQKLEDQLKKSQDKLNAYNKKNQL